MMINGSNVTLKSNSYVKKLSDANHFVNFVIENAKENNILSLSSNITVIQSVIN